MSNRSGIVLALSVSMVLGWGSQVQAAQMTLGYGVVADVTIAQVLPRTRVENIRNTTGVDADDFHIHYSIAGVISVSFNYRVTPGPNDLQMDAAPNGSLLRVGGVNEVITFSENAGSIEAWWTNGGVRLRDPNGPSPIPEPSSAALAVIGAAGILGGRLLRPRLRAAR